MRMWRAGVVLGLVVTAFVATTSAADGYVYWAVRGGGSGSTLGRANLNGKGADPSFVTGATGPVGVTVDASHIYWANTFGTTIGRANLNGSGAKQNFITGAAGPCGVAVNGSFIYWANNTSNSIGRANLNGTGANQSFIPGADHPCGVAVNGSFIYWANQGDTTIGRANLNGTGANNSFIPGSGGCTDFPVVDSTYIYWANDCATSLGRARLNGTAINQDFVATGPNPGGVAVDQLAPLKVLLSGHGKGSVSGAGISCPKGCSRSYMLGKHITLSAKPKPGSQFAGWSGAGCFGTGRCRLTISAVQTVRASFTPRSACTLKSLGNHVLLGPVTNRGTLSFRVRCPKPASLSLAGQVLDRGNNQILPVKAKHAKATAGKPIKLTLKLPKSALAALEGGAPESAVFTVTSKASKGSGARTVTLAKLEPKK